MKIIDVRATTVTVPLEAPLRHANGCHWGRFVRTIVEIESDTGLVGLGEMGGGGESAVGVVQSLKAQGRANAPLAQFDTGHGQRWRQGTYVKTIDVKAKAADGSDVKLSWGREEKK